ncbi:MULTISPECIES: type VI secretion system Vgr family protein [Methylomicrobium]|uniref:Rhs element Vgr protein n=1 Tax=Methylomicrobium album BG8 TaxID=686340 RepID=H8GN53_METAL|nr:MULTISPECIES: type VI secretion system tip protein VgrG [Methylomicrobium]EIC30767.1 Rhs element Vgr protein [Methylomicrobium album BG8]
MPISQAGRVASVTTPLPENDLFLWRVSGSEQLSRLFEYELDLLSEKNNINLKPLLGKSMTIKLNLLDEAGQRSINGMVIRASRCGMMGRFYHYRATLRPKAWLLTRRSNCRIMPTLKTVPEIVKLILEEHGVSEVELKLSHEYSKREYCVQYRESDFDFISRLMEDEGIYYYFDHGNTSHTLMLCDSVSSQKSAPVNANILYFPQANENRRKEGHIYEWSLSQEIQPGNYELDDFDFEAPSTDLTSKSSNPGAHSEGSKEVYDYPGGYKKKPEGEHYSKVRLEELRSQFEQISARGNARQLAAGMKFTLVDFPVADQNREYVIVSSDLRIQNNGYESDGISDCAEEYECAYRVLPAKAENQYRPVRLTPIPVVQGVQTAIVVGKSGEEIYTDKYGRIKVQFHWDREGKKDENSSCWVRVAQIWAGKNWGAIHIPRVGQEVIVDFLEGNPDRPIVTGAVYNADQMPPYELEANKTQSGIKSRSSKGAGAENFNEIRFEDKKGEEELYIHAEKNFTRIVENNDVQKIGFDKKDAGDQAIDIYNHRTVTLDQGNDSLTVKTGNRTVSVDTGNHELTVKTGNRSASIDTGNDSVKVKTGNRTVKVDLGSIEEEAMQSIELKVGQNSITIDQKGITLKGIMITIEGQVKTDLKSPMTTVNGDGILTMKGGIVMIN